MGMVGCFRRLPQADLERLLEDPSVLPEYLEGEVPAGFGSCMDLDVDKAWHGIHFLLTGTASEGAMPLGFIVDGGTTIGEDMGYGPARGFSDSEVARIAGALAAVSAAEIHARYDAAELARAEVYPDIWERDGDHARDYLVTYFEQLSAFIAGAAEEREALIVFIS
jgi:hypothetical protein